MDKQDIKIVHVHLIFERKDFYFGSLSAVFDTLEEDRVGIKKKYAFTCRFNGWEYQDHKKGTNCGVASY